MGKHNNYTLQENNNLNLSEDGYYIIVLTNFSQIRLSKKLDFEIRKLLNN